MSVSRLAPSYLAKCTSSAAPARTSCYRLLPLIKQFLGSIRADQRGRRGDCDAICLWSFSRRHSRGVEPNPARANTARQCRSDTRCFRSLFSLKRCGETTTGMAQRSLRVRNGRNSAQLPRQPTKALTTGALLTAELQIQSGSV